MKTILLTGRTDLITTKIIEQLSRRFSVVLTSQDKDRQEDEGRVYHIQPGSTYFQQLFWAYDFNAVWYFSSYCDDGEVQDDFSELTKVCSECRENGVKKLLVVSSSVLTPDQMAGEEKILFAARKSRMQIVLLRLPGILVDGNENNSLGKLFSKIYHRTKTIRLPDIEGVNYEFLPMRDLIGLMTKITLSAHEEGIYQIPGEFIISKEQLREEISAVNPKISLKTDGRILKSAGSEAIDQLSKKYSYQVRDQKQLNFRQLYGEYAKKETQKAGGPVAWITKQRSRMPKQLVRLIDIVVLFVLAEILSQYTSDFIWFREIDVRLIYIFLIATFHGLQAGVVAALAECVMLFFGYQQLGIYGLQLFYNVENWIPFVLCIVTGAVTGYFSDLKDNERKLVDSENALLREKYLFLNDMYNVSSEVRDEYRKQILTFENSYGKVYDAIMSMECDTVREVCRQAKRVMEQFLENRTVSIYRFIEADNRAEYLKLSEEDRHPDIIVLKPEEMKAMSDQLMAGKVFRNVSLLADLPMYAMCLKPGSKLSSECQFEPLLVVIWETMPDQMNDYYSNQFEIMCGLMENALTHAVLRETAGKDCRVEVSC